MPDREWWAKKWDRSEYDHQRYEAIKRGLIEMLGGQCMECGTAEDLEFDHVSPDLKRFAITKRWNRSDQEFWEELAKCQLLCHPHHLEKTRREADVGHGGGKYGKRGCKCDLCKLRRRDYMREYKRARREHKKIA